MRVEVLIFGPLADLAGSHRIGVELADRDATAEGVLAAVGRSCPALQPMLASCRLAVNHAFAHRTTPIGPSDELAVIGLVSGG